MKVLAIRGRNIASLAQDFEVDLQAEPLASVNLFAIAGPTGAGKSSLLDALCLALYDQTPRLRTAPTQGSKLPDGNASDLSASDSRQLLRRDASEGHAEVDFIGVDGQPWRARWSVRRARGRRTGRLQAVEMSLLQLPGQTPAVGTGKKGETLAEIERRVGLDYRQFTHSVLLAQNEFAAFLRADQDERARLLQALTGSERFERLSMAAYERSRLERERLAGLERQWSSQQPLDAAARSALDEAADQARLEHEAASAQRDHERLWLAWQREEQQRQGALDQARARRLQTEAELAQAADDRQRIASLRQLQPLRPLWLKVDELNTQRRTRQVELAQSQTLLQSRSQVLAEAEGELARAQADLQQQRDRATELQPQLERAQRLEQQMEHQQSLLDSAAQALDTARSAMLDTDQTLAEAEQQAQRLRQALSRSTAQLEARPADASLLPQGVPWRAQIGQLRQLQPELAARQDEWRHQVDRLQQLAQEQADLHVAVDDLDRNIEACRHDLVAREAALRDLAPADLADRRAQWHADQEQARGRHEALRALATVRRARQRLLVGIAQAQDELNAITEGLPQAQAALLASEAALGQAESALTAARTVTTEATERLRAELEADRPCPVCGSVDHPWRDRERLLLDLGAAAPGNRTDALRELLSTLTAQRAQAAAAARQRRDQWLHLQTREQTVRSTLERDGAARVELEQDIEARLLAWESDDSFHVWQALEEGPLADVLETEQQQLKARQAALEAEQQAWQAAQEAREQARLVLDQKLAQFRDLQSFCTAAQQRQHQAELAKATLEAQIASASARQAQLRTQLRDWLKPLGLPLHDDLAQLDQRLDERARAHAALLEQHANDRARLSEIDTQIPIWQERMRAQHATTAQAAQRVATLTVEWEQLQRQRQQLFDGASIARVRDQLQERLDDAEARLEQQRQTTAEARQAFSLANASVDRLTEQLDHTEGAWQSARLERLARWDALAPTWSVDLPLELIRQLAHEPLGDEPAALVTARRMLGELLAVEPEALSTLEATQRRLDDALLRAQSEESTLANAVQAHQDARPQGTAPADPEAAVEQAEARLAQTLLGREALQSRRLADDLTRQQQAQLGEQLSAQRECASLWQQLNALMGSADGKKFRNLAQRRSLQLLLHHGNAQLRLFGSRYSLRAQADELNFLLVDHDLGDELRLVHSLSGGESFLVSLALALALASLSSQDLPIESLFVDEGFGSLDEDTLEVAMRALDQLQAQGRKVGVISHLRELTDRIGVKVEVIPVGTGRSRVAVSTGGFH